MAEPQIAPTPVKKPTENPQDILIVKNIDTNCAHIEYPSARRSIRNVDDEGRVTVSYSDDVEEVDHSKYFQVKWAGQRFRIAPGETRLYPRYIAEHFAKHLTDHILGMKQIEFEKAKKPASFLNNPSERDKVWKQIITGVQQYFNDLGEIGEGQQALSQVEQLNASPMAQELGIDTGKSLELKEDGDVQVAKKDPMAVKQPNNLIPTEQLLQTAVDDPNEQAPAGIDPDVWARTTKVDLIRQLRQLDPLAQLTGQESKGSLMAKLKGF